MRQDATCSVKSLILHLRINDERLYYPLVENRATYLAVSLARDLGLFRCWSDASVEFPPIKFRERACLLSLPFQKPNCLARDRVGNAAASSLEGDASGIGGSRGFGPHTATEPRR